MPHLWFFKIGNRESPPKEGSLSLAHPQRLPPMWFLPVGLIRLREELSLSFSESDQIVLVTPLHSVDHVFHGGWCWAFISTFHGGKREDYNDLNFWGRGEGNDYVVILYCVLWSWTCFEFHIKMGPTFPHCEVIQHPHFAPLKSLSVSLGNVWNGMSFSSLSYQL